MELRRRKKLTLKAKIKKYFMCRKDSISDSHIPKLWMSMRKLLNENHSCCILLPVIAEKGTNVNAKNKYKTLIYD